MCKGSCRRTPTEGLAECRRWQPVLLVRCPDGQAVLPHPVKQPSKMMQSASQSPLSACGGLSPLCTRGAVASRCTRSCLCRIAHNHPFLWHFARISPRPLPVLARQRRSRKADNAYSLQRVLAVATRHRWANYTVLALFFFLPSALQEGEEEVYSIKCRKNLQEGRYHEPYPRPEPADPEPE